MGLDVEDEGVWWMGAIVGMRVTCVRGWGWSTRMRGRELDACRGVVHGEVGAEVYVF